VLYAERGLSGHGGGFQPVGGTAGDEEIIAFPCEVDHGCDATGSGWNFRAFFAGMLNRREQWRDSCLQFRTRRDAAEYRSCRRFRGNHHQQKI